MYLESTVVHVQVAKSLAKFYSAKGDKKKCIGKSAENCKLLRLMCATVQAYWSNLDQTQIDLIH